MFNELPQLPIGYTTEGTWKSTSDTRMGQVMRTRPGRNKSQMYGTVMGHLSGAKGKQHGKLGHNNRSISPV